VSGIRDGREGGARQPDDGRRQRESRYLKTLPGISFAELLDVIQIPHEEFIPICHRPVGGRFIAEVVRRDEAPEVVAGLPHEADVWFGPNPTYGSGRRRSGRGREVDVTRWSVFNLDLDVKPDGFENLAQAEAFIDTFSAKIEMRPAVVIFSGHGLQPIWIIEEEPLDDTQCWSRACCDSRQIGRLAAQLAYDTCGAMIDTVSNLDRLVRASGTTNWKDPDNPMPTFAVRDVGEPLGLVEIEDALACLGIGDLSSDEPVFDEILSDCEDWDFGEQDCEYVISMVCAWDKESDRPRAGRHQWALHKAVRLAAAHRLGCLTADGLCAALEHLHRCMEYWCSTVGHPRALHHDEVGSAYRWAMRKVATFDDDQTRDQLGDHRHRGAWSTW
jgi:hypothetical protein